MDCIFRYGALTLSGRPSHAVLLTRPNPSFAHQIPSPSLVVKPGDHCGPTTPISPFESIGLGSSDFARHYFRNHGCFLFLPVLRWFTSRGSLRTPMYSAHDFHCSQRKGFPIRISPDHRLPAPPRSFSQLATSFIACSCQGIHTHALSSLTIKLTPLTESVPLALTSHFHEKRTLCYPSDIQLSKIVLLIESLLASASSECRSSSY